MDLHTTIPHAESRYADRSDPHDRKIALLQDARRRGDHRLGAE